VSTCRLSCPACNAHGPFCHLWPALIYNILPHHLINGKILEKKTHTQNVCFDFPYNFVPKHFSFSEELSKIRSKMYIGLQAKYRNSYPISMKSEFSAQFFRKNTQNSNFMKPRLEPSCSMETDGRKDGKI
jgi:hypothetical protein